MTHAVRELVRGHNGDDIAQRRFRPLSFSLSFSSTRPPRLFFSYRTKKPIARNRFRLFSPAALQRRTQEAFSAFKTAPFAAALTLPRFQVRMESATAGNAEEKREKRGRAGNFDVEMQSLNFETAPAPSPQHRSWRRPRAAAAAASASPSSASYRARKRWRTIQKRALPEKKSSPPLRRR